MILVVFVLEQQLLLVQPLMKMVLMEVQEQLHLLMEHRLLEAVGVVELVKLQKVVVELEVVVLVLLMVQMVQVQE